MQLSMQEFSERVDRMTLKEINLWLAYYDQRLKLNYTEHSIHSKILNMIDIEKNLNKVVKLTGMYLKITRR